MVQFFFEFPIFFRLSNQIDLSDLGSVREEEFILEKAPQSVPHCFWDSFSLIFSGQILDQHRKIRVAGFPFIVVLPRLGELIS
jgi:hypothetical protein